jgi:hypothetical protein
LNHHLMATWVKIWDWNSNVISYFSVVMPPLVNATNTKVEVFVYR